MEQIGETMRRRGRWRDIVRSAGIKGEPIGGGSANDDAVDCVLELANERIGVARRRGVDVYEIRGGRLVGLVPLRKEVRERRHGFGRSG